MKDHHSGHHKTRIGERLAEALDYPLDITGGVSDMRVRGGKEVIFDGCSGIALYHTDEIRLRMCDMTVCVTGADMIMKSYFGGHIEIYGEIRAVSFER